MKARTGYIYKEDSVWIARITFTDAAGRRRNVKRRAATRTEARRKLDKMRRPVRGPRRTPGVQRADDLRRAGRQVRQGQAGAGALCRREKVAGLRSAIPPRSHAV